MYTREGVRVEHKNAIIYNKLVRDRIPEIIESSGKTCTTEILSNEDYLRMLEKKLDEELAEYHQDQSIEELADLLEVIRAVVIARGSSLEELERIREEKAQKRGGFEKKILLKEVQEWPLDNEISIVRWTIWVISSLKKK